MKYDSILVTVITCVYNTPLDYLKEAVRSILGQTHQNFEYFIVDDCSENDLFRDALFDDSRITIIRLKENSGPSVARNVAIDRAKGKYIAIMDSDDVSLPDRFEKQIAFMENNPDVVACGTWFTFFGDKTHDVKRLIDDNEYYQCCLLFGNNPTLLNPSVMFRRATLETYQIRFDPRLRKAEDYKVWVQLSQIGKCTNLHEILFRYRVHNSQTSQKLYTKDISPYDWIVMQEQFEQMQLVLSDEEKAILQKDFRSREVPPYQYLQILNKMLQANQKSGFFVQEKLERRVEEQWKQKVYNTSRKDLFALMKKLPSKERRRIIRMEIQRLWRKIGFQKRKDEQR